MARTLTATVAVWGLVNLTAVLLAVGLELSPSAAMSRVLPLALVGSLATALVCAADRCPRD